MIGYKSSRSVFGVAIILVAGSGVVSAQPWDRFIDSLSSSRCGVVNAENAELVVLTETGELVSVSGSDVTLANTFVDLDGNVFFEGQQAGFIDFVDDGDGFRTLWWTGLTGQVVVLDGFTSVPVVGNLFPEDFVDVACDACPLWDDPTACDDCIDDLDCSDGLFCNGVEACISGTCIAGFNPCPFQDCDEFDGVCFASDTSPFVLNFCGASTALTMSLTLMGLVSLRLVRRRLG